MNRKVVIGVVGAIALVGAVQAAAYVPESWNVEAREKYAAQRFGVFVHWGLYANYAQGEWYLQQGGVEEAAYARMMHGFCPSKFDAKEWVRIVKGAGARYLTITSRHHDSFSLWPTKADDGYNIANTPFKRDVLGELAAACREAGLQLNFYYSLMDWHRPDYPTGREKAARLTLPVRREDYASYKRFMLRQIAELCDAYQPGCIWFDGEWDHDPQWSKEANPMDWGFDEIYDLIHSKKALVANNHHHAIRDKEDIQLFERDLPGENTTGYSPNRDTVTRDRPLEQCDVIQENVWGYKIGERKFRTPEEVCAMICRAAAKDSNMLMNVGPDGSGQFPAQAVVVMAEVGKWMAANGEAIYGTRGGGIVKNADGSETAATRKGDVVYEITLAAGAYPVVRRK